MKVNVGTAFLYACGAVATKQFAKDTGNSWVDCHTEPKGGGTLTPFGEEFNTNGNKTPN